MQVSGEVLGMFVGMERVAGRSEFGKGQWYQNLDMPVGTRWRRSQIDLRIQGIIPVHDGGWAAKEELGLKSVSKRVEDGHEDLQAQVRG